MSSTPRLIGTLIVVVLKARNLPNKRHIGKQDPYCTLKLHNEAKKTKPVKRGGQHPEWDEELRFELFEDIEDELARTAKGTSTPPAPPPKDKTKERKVRGGKIMRLLCYADDPREPELIGEAAVDLTEVLTKGETDEWFTLMNKDKYSGEIYLELTFWSNEKPPEKSHSARPSTLHPQYGGPGSFTPSGEEGGRTSSTGSSPAPGNRIPVHGRQGSGPVNGGKPSASTSTSLSQLNLYIPPYDRDPAPHHRPYDPSMEFGDPSRRRESYPPRNAPQQPGFAYQSAYGPNPYDNNIPVPQPDPYAASSPSSAYYQTSQSAQYTSSIYSQNATSLAPSGFVPPQPTMTPQPSGFQPIYIGFTAPHPSATPVPSFIPPPSSMGFHNYQNPVGYPSQTPVPQMQPQMPPFQHHPNSYPAANPPVNSGLSTIQTHPPLPPASAPPVQAYGTPHQLQQASLPYQQVPQQGQLGQGRPLPDQPHLQQPLAFPTANPYTHGQPNVQTQVNPNLNQSHNPNPPVGTGFVAPPPPPPIQPHRASSLPTSQSLVTSPTVQPGYGSNQGLALPAQTSLQQSPPGTISANHTGGSGRSGGPLPPLPNPPGQTQSTLYVGPPAPSATPLPGPPPPLPKPPVPQGHQHAQQPSYGAQSNIGYTPQQLQQQQPQYTAQPQYQAQGQPQVQAGAWNQAPQNYTNGGTVPGYQYGPGQQPGPNQPGAYAPLQSQWH